MDNIWPISRLVLPLDIQNNTSASRSVNANRSFSAVRATSSSSSSKRNKYSEVEGRPRKLTCTELFKPFRGIELYLLGVWASHDLSWSGSGRTKSEPSLSIVERICRAWVVDQMICPLMSQAKVNCPTSSKATRALRVKRELLKCTLIRASISSSLIGLLI